MTTLAERLTVRLKGVGPIGFVKAVLPCSLASLRQLMADQIAQSLPDPGFRFLAGGMPVGLAQEAAEDYQEGDVLIAALPPGSSDSVAPGAGASSASDMPVRAPSQSLVAQWVDAFGFMCATPAKTPAAASVTLRVRMLPHVPHVHPPSHSSCAGLPKSSLRHSVCCSCATHPLTRG